MTIRLATAEDKDQVLSLLDEFSGQLAAKEIPSHVGGAIFDKIINHDDLYIFVAEEDGKIYGLVTFYMLPNIRHGWHRGHIEDFFVAESVRGKGVGSELFNYVKEYCKEHNIKVIKLDSGNELVDAHKFYEKHGGRTSERFFRFDIS
jgi:GNAT superfamily N-acetyltransferase